MGSRRGPAPAHQHRHAALHERFELLKTLGEGTYGKVKLAVEIATGNKYAIKSIRKSQIETSQDLARIRREIEIMSSLNHPHIISVYEVVESSEQIVMVMEYASGGELYDYISACNNFIYSEQGRVFFRQLVSAVHYMHQRGIVHRDLKLENIVLDENNNLKIADFGLSNICRSDHLLNTFCGSPLYASPEIVNGLPYRGPEVDCWSLGVLLYTFVYGAMPFDGSDFHKLRQHITQSKYREPKRPSDASGLIRQLLRADWRNRATVDDACRHWWTNLGYKCSPIEECTAVRVSPAAPRGVATTTATARHAGGKKALQRYTGSDSGCVLEEEEEEEEGDCYDLADIEDALDDAVTAATTRRRAPLLAETPALRGILKRCMNPAWRHSVSSQDSSGSDVLDGSCEMDTGAVVTAGVTPGGAASQRSSEVL